MALPCRQVCSKQTPCMKYREQDPELGACSHKGVQPVSVFIRRRSCWGSSSGSFVRTCLAAEVMQGMRRSSTQIVSREVSTEGRSLLTFAKKGVMCTSWGRVAVWVAALCSHDLQVM